MHEEQVRREHPVIHYDYSPPSAANPSHEFNYGRPYVFSVFAGRRAQDRRKVSYSKSCHAFGAVQWSVR